MLVRRIRVLLLIFIAGLIVSGATAIPLETEINLLTRKMDANEGWLGRIRDALVETNAKYPFLPYGTDWLAFAHFIIAIAFIGQLGVPLKNAWVIEFGMMYCVLVVPFDLV